MEKGRELMAWVNYLSVMTESKGYLSESQDKNNWDAEEKKCNE